jgi:hypothetical protein
MKITLIGSTQYREKFLAVKQCLEDEGHEVKIVGDKVFEPKDVYGDK